MLYTSGFHPTNHIIATDGAKVYAGREDTPACERRAAVASSQPATFAASLPCGIQMTIPRRARVSNTLYLSRIYRLLIGFLTRLQLVPLNCQQSQCPVS